MRAVGVSRVTGVLMPSVFSFRLATALFWTPTESTRVSQMAEKAMPMTKEGMERLEKELANLRDVRRHEVAARIHEAKELASAQNNSEYEEAKNEQAFVEGRIMTLEHLLANATVIDEEAAHHASRVQLGTKVSCE